MPDDTRPAPHPWLGAIEEGLADIAAGRTYDLDTVILELEAEDAAPNTGTTHDLDRPASAS